MTKQIKIGAKVKLTRELARWSLNNPDIFFPLSDRALDKREQKAFDSAIQLAFFVCIGVPVFGEVIGLHRYDDDTVRVLLRSAGIEYDHYFNVPTDVEVVKEKVK